MLKTMRAGALATALVAVASMAAAASANAETVRVDANGVAGWMFNRDPGNVTPYAFSTAEKSIGAGSLHVAPIANTVNGAADKFIAELPLGAPTGDVSISFDFLMDLGAGAPANAHKHFYINVYTNLPGSSTWYDCRFDYVAGSGSTGAFATVGATPAATPTNVRARGGASCPATLGGMPAGSLVSFFSLNVGDTSANDTGVGGYLDNVVVDVSSESTTYDFEATPADKGACKAGRWADYGFANQGLCIARSLELGRL